jgi:hypothetical protein
MPFETLTLFKVQRDPTVRASNFYYSRALSVRGRHFHG